MKPYKKTDQEYYDDYDRFTIETLKKLESELGESIYQKSPNLKSDEGDGVKWNWEISAENYNPFTHYYQTAVRRAQNRKEAVLERIKVDENRDQLVSETKVPNNIRCKSCDSEMVLETHYFRDNDTSIFFVFSCPQKHKPKRIMHPNGRTEWKFEAPTCEKCGGDLDSITEQGKSYLKITDTCIDCGHISTLEYKIDPKIEISSEDREKYCTYWEGRKTFIQDLEAIMDFKKYYDEVQKSKREKINFGVDKIEILKLPQLENRLKAITEQLGYTKFNIDSHSNENYLTISFSFQDPSDRDEKESVKIISNTIKKSLFPTNWRLINKAVDYRLGLITGKIRAYDGEEGLLKIAKEIFEKAGASFLEDEEH